MANPETVCRYIKDQRLVRFTYNGYNRVAELYMQGTTTENTVVKARQIDGDTSDPVKPLPAWKTFETSKIRNLRQRNQSFDADKDYTGKDSDMKVNCKL